MSGPRGFPLDREFYARLAASADRWQTARREVVPAGRGHGCLVRAGQTAKLVMLEGAQIIDLDIFSAADPDEYLHAPTQLYIEGGRVSAGTRLWGTPPRTRPLATVVADRIDQRDERSLLRDHKCYGAHCNPHQWLLFAGYVPRTCYDNLSEGCRMIGLAPRRIHDNLNLYMKAALEPTTGRHLNVTSDARAGDYIQFYAEMDLFFVMSLCPYGDGSVVPEDWATTPVSTRPVAVEIADTGTAPLGWPRDG
jgi:uncharacterized protein YcgI (DUF1989 family)